MQTPKTRAGTLEVPQRTPKTARQLKTSGTDPDNSSSQSPATRTPKVRSPKVVDRRSPRTPTSEKKRPGKMSELETQLAQLQEELKKAKDQLNQSESSKKRAHQDAEEAKKQLSHMSEKLEESQQQLNEISASEESRLQELRKISQDRDRAWESELEAIQKHHSMDSAALISAMNEIQKLKIQLENLAESEANQAKYTESAHNEMLKLRLELSETLALVEELKTQLNDCKDSEARAMEIVGQTREQMEIVKSTEDTLRSEYDSLTIELEKSKAQVNSLEGIVSKLKDNNENRSGDVDDQEELNNVKSEAEKLRDALEGAERRYQEEYIQSTLQIRSAYELVEQTRSESCQKVAILEANLEESKAELDDLKVKLQNITEENKNLNEKLEKTELTTEKEAKLDDLKAKLQNLTEENKNLNEKLEKIELTTGKEAELDDLKVKLQNITEENKNLNEKLEKIELTTEKDTELANLKRVLSDKETELKNIMDDTERLMIEKTQMNNAEREALMKVGFLTEEADKSSRKVVRVSEQLDLAQAANAEMEAELRRLKVQSDQWRKAAEAAAAMLSGGNNGKFVERTGSLDSHTIGGKLNSPFLEDMEDESPKKKNGNMLKKIGVLLKKSQK